MLTGKEHRGSLKKSAHKQKMSNMALKCRAFHYFARTFTIYLEKQTPVAAASTIFDIA
jgi:hypothetical protein